ncbi:hypothetical protein V1514DRAFT_319996 [Lipomyces japonicus]|uniref:uncharacterized protein n=1 Tax=Lipomyces japonicus TaxID=56871 RepID=UPI0034CD3EC8
MSVALLRTRERYRTRNLITGAIMFTFVGAVYTYAATATGADDMSDVPLPPISDAALAKLQQERDTIKDSAK